MVARAALAAAIIMAAIPSISDSKEGRQPDSSHTMCLPSAFNFAQVSLTLEESHLRTSSAGGCGAVTSPTFRLAPAGAFVRCTGDLPRWRVRARPPKNRSAPRPPAASAAPIIPPLPPAVKSSQLAWPLCGKVCRNPAGSTAHGRGSRGRQNPSPRGGLSGPKR